MATPVDFSQWGLWRNLAAHDLPLDEILDADGNVPASTIRQGFRLLKPTGEIRQYATLLDNVWNDEYVTAYQAMTGWSNDTCRSPAPPPARR